MRSRGENVSDTIKCVCEKCGAKYRLPVEFQGRSARCKKCGEKFRVPELKGKSLEDSVLDWLDEREDKEEVVQPRVINMQEVKSSPDDSASGSPSNRGIIRYKS